MIRFELFKHQQVSTRPGRGEPAWNGSRLVQIRDSSAFRFFIRVAAHEIGTLEVLYSDPFGPSQLLGSSLGPP
jgi:hypothetical protein